MMKMAFVLTSVTSVSILSNLERCVVVCLYMDDMINFGTKVKFIKSIKRMITNNSSMKDLGVTGVILGMKIRTSNEILITLC